MAPPHGFGDFPCHVRAIFSPVLPDTWGIYGAPLVCLSRGLICSGHEEGMAASPWA